MADIVASYMPFPPISWFAQLYRQDTLLLDGFEHFEKMSLRNRYAIAGANGKILLSLPLVKGRNQRTAMKDVQIFNGVKWQKQHWRTLVSVYRRSPYFQHFEPELQHFYQQPFENLIDFNEQTIRFLMKQFGMRLPIGKTESYEAFYKAPIKDRRRFNTTNISKDTQLMPSYTQVFSERNGFLADLSALDLLFSQGPMVAAYLGKMHEIIGE
jgi:WbqC-like protein family